MIELKHSNKLKLLDEGPSSVPTIPTINEDISKADADGSSPNIAVPLSNEDNDERWETVDMPPIRIAAIDNGLAFPFKHPESWRSCNQISS